MMMVCVAILIFLLMFLFLNYRYMNSYYYRNLLEFENRPINGIQWPNDIKMVNLGSVHSRFAFEYKMREGVNLARSPQSLYYDIQLLENYSNKIPENSVIIAFLPFCLFALKNYKNLSQLAKYYSELPPERIEDYSFIKKIIACYFPILYAGKHIVYSVINRKVESEFSYQRCMVKDTEFHKIAKDHQAVWMKQFRLENTTNASVEHLSKEFKYNRSLLKEIINICKSNNWQLVFVTGPVTRDINELFSEDFLDKFYYSNFRDIAKENNILHLDYRLDEEFQDEHDYFWNGVDWLSGKGREIFMEKLKNDLKISE